MKLKIRLDDPETRAVWEAAQRARAEVESWPSWKRGEGAAAAEESPTARPEPNPGESRPESTEDE
jgi:hypothetical protein